MFAQYEALGMDGGLIGLAREDVSTPYFCYPANARSIGFDGCILYCFLPEYGGMVFAANPESCADSYVYPLARDFSDFLRLILACGSTNPIEQIIWMDRALFERHLQEELLLRTEEQKAALALLGKELGLSPMENPFGYVKGLQKTFDDSKIQYRDEYYEALGIER